MNLENIQEYFSFFLIFHLLFVVTTLHASSYPCLLEQVTQVHRSYRISKSLPICQMPSDFLVSNYTVNEYSPIPYRYLRRLAHFPKLLPEYFLITPKFNKPKLRYTITTNVFLDANGNIFCGQNTSYYHEPRLRAKPGIYKVEKELDIAFNILGEENKYGHLINDVILQFGNIPWCIVQKGYFVTNNWRLEMARQAIQIIFKISEPNVIAHGGELYYCHQLLTFEAKPQWCTTGYYSAYKIVSLLKERIGVTNKPATKYIISNRQPGLNRYIPNFKEVSTAIVNRFPHINWTVTEDYVKGLANTVVYWNRVKFIYGPNGSNMCNACFMRADSVIVMIRPIMASDAMDNTLASMVGVWMFTYPQEGWKHWGIATVPANVTRALQFVECGLYTLEHQRWPDSFPLSRLPVLNESYPLDCTEKYCTEVFEYKKEE